MLIYEALKKDHEVVKGLMEELVRSAQASEETRSRLISQIRDELIPHARAEEAVFYNPLKTIEGMDEVVNHGYAEHVEAEGYLRLLQTLDAADIEWLKVAEKLKESLEHHVEEEEGRIFEAAKTVLVEEEARLMAEAFEKMKPEIREGSFMSNTMDLIANLMPARFAEPLRSFTHRI